MPEEVKKRALNLLKTKYQRFGPTLAHEKLVEKEKLKLSDESLRKLMIEEGLWKPRKAKKVVVHQLRERRACFGELVQIDGSPHDWFEGRAPACVLLVFIDDATGKLLQLLFVENESFSAMTRRRKAILASMASRWLSTAINTGFFGSMCPPQARERRLRSSDEPCKNWISRSFAPTARKLRDVWNGSSKLYRIASPKSYVC